MQKLQAQHDTRGIKACTCLIEHLLVYVHHEIATVGILHHEAHVFGRLKTREQVDEERMVASIYDLEYSLLRH